MDDPAYREAATGSLERAARVVPGIRVLSYLSTGSRDLVGQDSATSAAASTGGPDRPGARGRRLLTVAEALANAAKAQRRRRGRAATLGDLTARERAALELMGDGRSNAAIAESPVVTEGPARSTSRTSSASCA
ncbi:MAG TPA: hypothetical protein VK904_01215 [Miltoncostaeaceae bacterium]|nr:hypothetical protein [Miltoncostaeaceae bacterium]